MAPVILHRTMLASLALLFALGVPTGSQKPVLHDPATFQTDFNRDKGVPRVVIILSPS